MILSFSRNFAFVAVPRTGTHAVRSFLRPLLAPNDWEQCTRYERRLFPVPALARIGHGHIGAQQIQPFLLPSQWDGMFSFGFLRDPLDRFLSAFYFLRRDGAFEDRSPDAMKRILGDPEQYSHVLLRPQVGFLCDPKGRPLVDLIARYEQFEEGVAGIAGQLGVPAQAPRIVNAAPRPPGAPVDDELRTLVQHVYADDYRLLHLLDATAPRP